MYKPTSTYPPRVVGVLVLWHIPMCFVLVHQVLKYLII